MDNQTTKENASAVLPASSELYIKANKLSVGYANEVVVSNITFQLARTEAIALVGTNGSGKSTLLKTIVGLLPVMAGEL